MAEILLPELQLATGTGRTGLFLCLQLHPADLARNGFRQVTELDSPHTFVGRQLLTSELDDVAGQLRARGMALAQDDECLVLDLHAFQFEGADAITRGFEDVIAAADIGEVPGLAPDGDIAGTVVAAQRFVAGRRNGTPQLGEGRLDAEAWGIGEDGKTPYRVMRVPTPNAR